MEKKTKTIKGYVVKDKEVEVFISSDGTEFDKEKECIEHEKIITFEKKIKRIEIDEDILSIPYTFYLASDKEELSFILKRLGWEDRYTHQYLNGKYNHSEKPKVGDWIGVKIEDGGDSADTYNFYTIDFIRDKLTNLLKQINSEVLNSSQA